MADKEIISAKSLGPKMMIEILAIVSRVNATFLGKITFRGKINDRSRWPRTVASSLGRSYRGRGTIKWSRGALIVTRSSSLGSSDRRGQMFSESASRNPRRSNAGVPLSSFSFDARTLAFGRRSSAEIRSPRWNNPLLGRIVLLSFVARERKQQLPIVLAAIAVGVQLSPSRGEERKLARGGNVLSVRNPRSIERVIEHRFPIESLSPSLPYRFPRSQKAYHLCLSPARSISSSFSNSFVFW